MSAARPRLHLILLLLAAFLLHTAGLQRTLPLLIDVDEDVFVNAALRVAASGNPDPGFYGTPGTTTIYPLAVGARLWHAATQRGRLFALDPNFAAHAAGASYWEYYYLGRLLAVAYNVGAVALTALIGRRALADVRVGLAGGWLYLFYAPVLFHAKLVRTDTAATFFGLLALYLCLRLLDRPTRRAHLAAGVAIGFAVASRYFLIAAAAVLAAVDWLLLRRSRERSLWRWAALGWAAVPLTVLLLNPAFFLHGSAVVEGLRAETITTHLGADGLTPPGNALWYLSSAMPQAIGWLQTAAALAGALLLFRPAAAGRVRVGGLLLLLYIAATVLVVSLSPRHFARYIIPALPCVALLAAYGLLQVTDALASRAARAADPHSSRAAQLLASVGLLALLIGPAVQSVHLTIRQANANTRIEARRWMVEQLPPGSRILQENYGAAIHGTDFVVETVRALPDTLPDTLLDTLPDTRSDARPAATDLEPLRERGYDYVVVSSDIYDRFFAEAERYPDEVAFYERLFATGALVQEFAPAWYESGPVLRIYAP